jgi:hypothetical protein
LAGIARAPGLRFFVEHEMQAALVMPHALHAGDDDVQTGKIRHRRGQLPQVTHAGQSAPSG